MSRVGSAPITIPSGVEVSIDGVAVTVKGSKGTLEQTLPGGITVRDDEGTLVVERPDDTGASKSFHGLSRTLIQNMIIGVTDGFVKELQIQGVGYRATRRRSSSRGSTSSWSVRLPPTSASGASRSPTRARASAMSTSA